MKGLSISTKSAFTPWKPSIQQFNGYRVLLELLEAGEIRLSKNNITMTPFEACLWMEGLYIRCNHGVVKVINLKN